MKRRDDLSEDLKRMKQRERDPDAPAFYLAAGLLLTFFLLIAVPLAVRDCETVLAWWAS